MNEAYLRNSESKTVSMKVLLLQEIALYVLFKYDTDVVVGLLYFGFRLYWFLLHTCFKFFSKGQHKNTKTLLKCVSYSLKSLKF